MVHEASSTLYTFHFLSHTDYCREVVCPSNEVCVNKPTSYTCDGPGHSGESSTFPGHVIGAIVSVLLLCAVMMAVIGVCITLRKRMWLRCMLREGPIQLTPNTAYPVLNHANSSQRDQQLRSREGGGVNSSTTSERGNPDFGGTDITNGPHTIQLQPNPVYTIHNESPPPAAERVSFTERSNATPLHNEDYLQLLPNVPSSDSNAQQHSPQPQEREDGSQCVPPAADEDDGEEEAAAVYYI